MKKWKEKPKPVYKKDTHLHIRVSHVFMDKLREFTGKKKVSVTDFVTDAVDEKIFRERER